MLPRTASGIAMEGGQCRSTFNSSGGLIVAVPALKVCKLVRMGGSLG